MKRLGSVTADLGSRLRRLTGRQGLAVAAAVTLGGGGAALALAGEQALATGLVAVIGALLLAGVVQLRRRVGQEIGALRGDVARLTERLVIVQRQVVAAVENERVANADRHEELTQVLTVTDASLPAARQPSAAETDHSHHESVD